MTVMRKALLCLTFVAAFVFAVQAHASPIQITVNTAGAVGDASLIFDLIDGDGILTTSLVKIYDFSTDGALVDGPTVDGDVTGTLPGTLLNPLVIGDSTFFNEYLQSITLGTF